MLVVLFWATVLVILPLVLAFLFGRKKSSGSS